MPDAAGTRLQANHSSFERSNQAYRPHANQPRGLVLGPAFYLDCQPHHLKENGRHQDRDITIATHKVFHKSATSFGCQLLANSTNPAGWHHTVDSDRNPPLRIPLTSGWRHTDERISDYSIDGSTKSWKPSFRGNAHNCRRASGCWQIAANSYQLYSMEIFLNNL